MNINNNKFIYESPDNGKTVFKRKFMDYENRTIIIQNGVKITTEKVTEEKEDNVLESLLNYLQQ